MTEDHLSLGRPAQQGYWSDLRADTGTLFFRTRSRRKVAKQTQWHKEESFFFVKGMNGCALDDSWSEC